MEGAQVLNLDTLGSKSTPSFTSCKNLGYVFNCRFSLYKLGRIVHKRNAVKKMNEMMNIKELSTPQGT